MKKILNRITSVTLAAIMTASSLTALSSCSKKEAEPLKEKRTNVYSGTEIAIPDGIDYIRNIYSVGDNIYLTYNKTYTVMYNDIGEEVSRTAGYEWSDEVLDDGWYQDYLSETYIATVPIDGGDITENVIKFEEDEDSYVNKMAVDSDGTVWALKSKWEYNEDYTESQSTFILYPIDPMTGETGDKILLNDAVKAAGFDQNNTYINNFVISDNGIIYINIGTAVIGINKDGTFCEKYDFGSDVWVNKLNAAGEKLYIVYSPNNGSQQIKVIENGQITDIQSENLTEIFSNYYGIYGFTDNKMYYGSSSGIGAYDFATDTGVEILNYINSDIDSSNGDSTIVLPDERVVMVQTDWSSVNNTTTLSILSRVPDELLEEEVILKLGCVNTDYYLTKAIIRFNKQNTGVRVSVVDYSQYNNEENEWKGASTQFNNDIVTGNLPDLILLSSELPVESYFQKGLFADLNEFIDDPEIGIDRANYLDNIFKACEVDGKLNSIIISFSIYTLVAKSQYVGTEPGWTLAEMMDVINNMPEGMSAFMEYSRQDILTNFFSYSMDTFINWDTGETYFADEGFIEFIKFLATCSETGYWEALYPTDGEYIYDEDKEKEYSQNYALRFYNDLSLFCMAYISGFTSIMDIYEQFAMDDITLIGYPTTDETSNGATIIPSTELAISTKSLAKKEAWSFIKYVLDDEDYNSRTWMFSTNIDSLETKKATAKENYYYYEQTEDDLQWYKDYYSEEYYEFMKNSNQPLDESTLDQTMDLIKNATKVQRSDSALLDIINEELSSFFAGTKSAEDTAYIINSRAKIYVSENS